MQTTRTLSSVGAILLLSLLAPLGAAARPPQPAYRRRSCRPRSCAAEHRRRPPHCVVGDVSADRRARGTRLRPPRDDRERGERRCAPDASSSTCCTSAAAARGRRNRGELAAHDSRAFRVRVRFPRTLQRRLVCARRLRTTREGEAERSGARPPSDISRSDRRLRGASRARLPRRAPPCSSGAHSLSPFGAHVYPETGNGGYTSLHTDVFLIYDAASNLFLPGNPRRPDRPGDAVPDRLQPRLRADVARTPKDGPDLTVGSVLVNGAAGERSRSCSRPIPATRTARTIPTRARTRPAQLNPVGGPQQQPAPAGLLARAADDDPNKQSTWTATPCPANKLVITPLEPDPERRDFVVTVNYTGRPGVHNDGDGTTEGWFRNDTARTATAASSPPSRSAPRTGCRSTTIRRAKPTYDFYDTVHAAARPRSPTASSSRSTAQPARRELPGRLDDLALALARSRIARYLVENSIGSLRPERAPRRERASSTTRRRTARSRQHKAAATRRSWTCRRTSPTSRARSTGRSRSRTDGVVDRRPERQLRGGDADEDHLRRRVDRPRHAPPREHAPVVGRQRLGGQLQPDLLQGGPGDAGRVLVQRRERAGRRRRVECRVRADPGRHLRPGLCEAPTCCGRARPPIRVRTTLFSGSKTYIRPGNRVHRPAPDTRAGELRRGVAAASKARTGRAASPRRSSSRRSHRSCRRRVPRARRRLTEFFTEWWDTVYPPGGGPNRPQITAPGLDGGGFHC